MLFNDMEINSPVFCSLASDQSICLLCPIFDVRPEIYPSFQTINGKNSWQAKRQNILYLPTTLFQTKTAKKLHSFGSQIPHVAYEDKYPFGLTSLGRGGELASGHMSCTPFPFHSGGGSSFCCHRKFAEKPTQQESPFLENKFPFC